jgi:hypothetical protein
MARALCDPDCFAQSGPFPTFHRSSDARLAEVLIGDASLPLIGVHGLRIAPLTVPLSVS